MADPETWAFDAVKDQQLARELREKLPPEAADNAIKEVALARQRHESREKRFGEMVRGWRLDRNWTQEDVAERLRHQGFEMHQTTVAKIERGARPLRLAEAAALATVFEMPVLAVFGFSKVEKSTGRVRSQYLELNQDVELEQARKRLDASRENLYGVAQQHAQLLTEVEKIVLQMNQAVPNEVAD